MSGQTQGGLPFDTSGAGGQLPGYTNSPTPAPGATYLGTQLNNLFSQLYGHQPQGNQPMAGMGIPTGYSSPGTMPTMPTYQGISQTAGGQQQTTGMSLGQQMTGTASPVAGPVASMPTPAPNPITTTPVTPPIFTPEQPPVPVIQGPPAQPGPGPVTPSPVTPPDGTNNPYQPPEIFFNGQDPNDPVIKQHPGWTSNAGKPSPSWGMAPYSDENGNGVNADGTPWQNPFVNINPMPIQQPEEPTPDQLTTQVYPSWGPTGPWGGQATTGTTL